MESENLSYEIEFLSNEKTANNEINNTFESNNNLAFNTNTTGILMQLEGLEEKNLQTINDVELFRKISSNNYESNLIEINNESILKGVDSETIIIENNDQSTSSKLTYEVIIGEYNNILPIWFLELGYERSKSICLISTSGIDYKDRKGSWQGSGFLISNNILLTNYHVLNSKDACENAICTFNFQMNEKGKIQSSKYYQLNPSRLFITSPQNDLDFAFVWVDGEPGKDFGYIPFLRHAFVVKENDFANIIQHPGGKVKSIALQNNQITFQKETVVHYTTDTLSGSSGALVANNEWKAFALHHATRELKAANIKTNTPAQYINEGIKLSAIATYLESISNNGNNTQIQEVLSLFNDTDAMLGYFGGLGREKNLKNDDNGLERVVEIYKGEAKDIDIAFWNIEWFNKHYQQKIEEVAKVIVRMNLDVWVFEESSPQATRELVKYLKVKYDCDYDCSESEVNAPNSKQTTTIIWNIKTVDIIKKKWSEKVERWFQLNSTGIETPEDLTLESDLIYEKVDGKIFDRYPGLFYLTSKNRVNEFNAYIVPLHLKAMGEGSKRRKLASKILATAIKSMIDDEDADTDWILGGDFNATLASEDFNYLLGNKYIALSVKDEKAGEMTYIKGKYKSLIDHIFISPNLKKTINSEYIIVAQDKTIPNYLSISDHRPVLIRLSLTDSIIENGENKEVIINNINDQELIDTIRNLDSKKKREKGTRKKPEISEATIENQLKSLENNKDQEYYNEVRDKEEKEKYYGKIPAKLSASELFAFLSKLITNTHKNVLAYKPSTYLYPWVDLQPDKQTINNIYSGDTTTPESLIIADFEAERKILETFYNRFPQDNNLESNMNEDELTFYEALENSQGFNCEHVVPQSWFSKQNPMRGDLHHLFSCTPNCNSFRSNIPYFEFPDWEEKVMDNCGLREQNSFEPKEGKGIVARATLYFLIRYPKIISQYNRQDIQTLLEWHVNEPPTLYEQHRNASIQELQGNRNPLIDYPKLSAKIDFSYGLSN